MSEYDMAALQAAMKKQFPIRFSRSLTGCIFFLISTQGDALGYCVLSPSGSLEFTSLTSFLSLTTLQTRL
jgi:hypothetical protein